MVVLVTSLLLALLVVSVLRMRVVADKLSILGSNIDRLDEPIGYCISQALQQKDLLEMSEWTGDGELSTQTLNLIHNPIKGFESLRRCDLKKFTELSNDCRGEADYLLNVEVEEASSVQQLIITLRLDGCDGSIGDQSFIGVQSTIDVQNNEGAQIK